MYRVCLYRVCLFRVCLYRVCLYRVCLTECVCTECVCIECVCTECICTECVCTQCVYRECVYGVCLYRMCLCRVCLYIICLCRSSVFGGSIIDSPETWANNVYWCDNIATKTQVFCDRFFPVLLHPPSAYPQEWIHTSAMRIRRLTAWIMGGRSAQFKKKIAEKCWNKCHYEDLQCSVNTQWYVCQQLKRYMLDFIKNSEMKESSSV